MQKQEGLSINWKAVTADRLLQNGLSPKNTAIVITTIENVIAHQIECAKAEERKREKKMRLKILHKVETVFFLYLATFPAPRDALQKEIQDTIKDVVNTLKENVVGIINIS